MPKKHKLLMYQWNSLPLDMASQKGECGNVEMRKCNSNGIILIRIKGQNTNDKIELVEKLILNHKNKIRRHYTIVSKNKIRFVPLEDAK